MVGTMWSLTLLGLAVGSTNSFLTAPLPAYARGLTGYDVTDGSNKRPASNEVYRVLDEEGDYLFEFDSEAAEDLDSTTQSTTESSADSQNPLDPWSIVWYIGSFGGLVAFFLVVSCSEWCCRRGARPLTIPYTQPGEIVSPAPCVPETPPPPYHLFAPPPYDSVHYGDFVDKTTGEKLDIFVIRVPHVQSSPSQAPV